MSERNQRDVPPEPSDDGFELMESPPPLVVGNDTKTFIGSEAVTGGGSVKHSIQVGGTVGKYQIRAQLGAGGMGAVYLAFDPLIEREVAIKVLSQEVDASSVALQRFLQEARSIGRLNHPNVVSIFDIDQWHGQYYIVMELLSGGSLSQLVDEKGALDWREACRIVAQAASGLAAAHQAGMVHRDIKPENLMMTGEGLVKVVDFGLSKLVDAANDTRTAVTKAGQILGTPQYMSPEQFESTDVDSRTDIYSLGATLFRLMTGRFPYQESISIVQVMTAHLTKPAPVVTEFNGSAPVELNRIVARAMQKRPDDRYQSATELADELTALLFEQRHSPQVSQEDFADSDVRPLRTAILVEPSKMQGAMMKNALLRCGATQIEVLQTGVDAIQAVCGQTPDIFITAMELEDGRGIDLLTRLCHEGYLSKACVVLNSSDSTMADLIEVGRAGSLLLAPKKVRPDDILCAAHAIGPCEVAQGGMSLPVDPLNVRLVLATESGRVPDPLAEMIRQTGLLDVIIVQGTDWDSIPAEGPPTVVILLRTAGQSAGDDLVYSRMVDRNSTSGDLTAAVQLDAEKLVLRAVSRRGVVAVTRRVLDENRLICLLQACLTS